MMMQFKKKSRLSIRIKKKKRIKCNTYIVGTLLNNLHLKFKNKFKSIIYHHFVTNILQKKIVKKNENIVIYCACKKYNKKLLMPKSSNLITSNNGDTHIFSSSFRM